MVVGRLLANGVAGKKGYWRLSNITTEPNEQEIDVEIGKESDKGPKKTINGG